MLIKFLDHGTGSGQKAAAYLLGRYDHTGAERAEVRVLRGDPQMVGKLADSLSFVHRYSSGVVAWHVNDKPDAGEIDRFLDDFEAVSFAGLDRSQYTYAAVLHVDADGSKHIHVLVPRVELAGGRSLNIAPPGWELTFGQLCAAWNWECGWARPDDPARARAIHPGPLWREKRRSENRGAKADKLRANGTDEHIVREILDVELDKRQMLEQFALRLVMEDAIADCAELAKALEAFGEVTRQGEDYISVKPRGLTKAVRLRGAIFNPDADYAALRRARMRAFELEDMGDAPAPAAEVDPERAAEARRLLAERVVKRAEHNRKRYRLPVRHLAAEAAERAEAQRLAREVTLAGIDRLRRAALSERGDVRGMRPQRAPAPVLDRVRELVIQEGGHNADDRARNAATESLDPAAGAAHAASADLERAAATARGCLDAVQRAGLAAVGAGLAAVEAGGRMMTSRSDELARFKFEVNLVEYAASVGFELDAKRSAKAAALLRHADGRKIVVATNAADGHGIWFDVGGAGGGGVIDLAQREIGGTIDQVRKELRGWVLSPKKPAPKRRPLAERPSKPDPVTRDRAALLARWHSLKPYSGGYLAERGISPEISRAWHPRQDDRGNLYIPHYSPNGVCGWEVWAPGFKDFSTGGERLLGMAAFEQEPATRIVVFESSIDAMSYAQIHHEPRTVYVSLAGSLSIEQIDQLLATAQGNGAALVLATDAGLAGEDIAKKIEAAAVSAGVAVTRDRPPTVAPAKDWNDVLCAGGTDHAALMDREAPRPGRA